MYTAQHENMRTRTSGPNMLCERSRRCSTGDTLISPAADAAPRADSLHSLMRSEVTLVFFPRACTAGHGARNHACAPQDMVHGHGAPQDMVHGHGAPQDMVHRRTWCTAGHGARNHAWCQHLACLASSLLSGVSI